MFEATVDVVADMKQEKILVKRCGTRESRQFGFADFADVGYQAVAVKRMIETAQSNAVRNACRFKAKKFDIPQFDGMVD